MPFAECLETCRKSRYRKISYYDFTRWPHGMCKSITVIMFFFPMANQLITVAVWTEMNLFSLSVSGMSKCASIHWTWSWMSDSNTPWNSGGTSIVEIQESKDLFWLFCDSGACPRRFFHFYKNVLQCQFHQYGH